MSQYNELWESYCTYYCSSAAKLAWPTVLAESHTSFSWFNKLFSPMASWNVTLYSVKYSLDFSAGRHIFFHFSLWLMTLRFLLATCGLDHPFLLLPDLWLCSQHVGCHQCPRLSQHNSGLPPPAGKSFDVHKPLGALGGKKLCKVHCLSCISHQCFPVDFLCSPWKVFSVLASLYSTSLQGHTINLYTILVQSSGVSQCCGNSAPLHLEGDSYCNARVVGNCFWIQNYCVHIQWLIFGAISRMFCCFFYFTWWVSLGRSLIQCRFIFARNFFFILS